MDIKKIKGRKRSNVRDRQYDSARMHDAYEQIIFRRMPELTNILSDFGVPKESFRTFAMARHLEIYSSEPPKTLPGYKPLLTDVSNTTGKYNAEDRGIFEEIRNDRLKLEIFSDFNFNFASNDNLSFLSLECDIILTLGDREIFTKRLKTFHNDSGVIKVVNALGYLYTNKEMYAGKNIYTTVRFNGLSIRSFIYTMNNLYHKDFSNEDIYIDTNNKKIKVKFPEFVKNLTGNSLMYYGGAQSKLGKADMNKYEKRKLVRSKISKAFLEYSTRTMGLNIQIKDILSIQPLASEVWDYETLEQFDPYSPTNTYKHSIHITVNNAFTKLPPRKLITREKNSPKEKDFTAKFLVFGLKLISFEVTFTINGVGYKIKFDNNEMKNDIVNSIKNNKKYSKPLNFTTTIPAHSLGSGYQRRNYIGSVALTPIQELERNFKNNKIDQTEYMERLIVLSSAKQGYTDQKPLREAERRLRSGWRKKLRRKQFAGDLFYLKYDDKYIGLFSQFDLYRLFPEAKE